MGLLFTKLVKEMFLLQKRTESNIQFIYRMGAQEW